MADFQQTRSKVLNLASAVSADRREYEQLVRRAQAGETSGNLSSDIENLRNRLRQKQAELTDLVENTIPDITNATPAKINFINSIAQRELDEIDEIVADLDSVQDRARLNNPENAAIREALLGNKDSAGDIVENEQNASVNDAGIQSPPQSAVAFDNRGRVVPESEAAGDTSNASQPSVADDISSNLPQPNASAVQGVPDQEIDNQSQSPVGNQGGATSTVGGAARTKPVEQTQGSNNAISRDVAPNDDATSSRQTSTATSVGNNGRPTVAKEFLEPIVSKPNILSSLSSVTYSLSWYLMDPDEAADFITNEKKQLPTNTLLVQSGGINNAERNQWFNVDFYIEDFVLESVVGTQDVGSPHNAVTLEMTVVEPLGITLLNRLNNAVLDKIGQAEEKIHPLSQSYLMVIRFYGYSANGSPVTAADLGLPSTTDSDAIVEKFVPFLITDFAYKIATKATEYKIKGACHGTNIAFSTQRGEIPFNIQLTAGSIAQLFNGNKALGQAVTQENNPSASTQTIVSGLTEALNEQQQRLAGESYDIPDEYEVIFADPDIQKAKLLKPGNANKGTASNQTSQQAAQRYLQSKLNYDKDSRTWNVPAGTTIAQLLDLVLRTSSYITSQQDVYIDEKTGKIVPTDQEASDSVPTVQWFRIKTQTVPIGYDTKRRTLAYKITYIVDKYQINTPRSPYFPPAEYRGVHKLYNYWFTGQNTEVLDFEIDVNNNYFLVIGNDGRIDTRDPGKFPPPQAYSSAPGQSLQGGEKGSTVPAANLSDRLYSIGDVANASIEIMGDPDWIQQSELVYNKSNDLSAFTKDGSVNYDSSEVLFELRFNPAQDYDLETGLANVYENNRDITIQGANETYSQINAAQESLVWTALTVTNVFKDGSFTQRINGAYRDFASAKQAPVGGGRGNIVEEPGERAAALDNRDNTGSTTQDATNDFDEFSGISRDLSNPTGLGNGKPKRDVPTRSKSPRTTPENNRASENESRGAKPKQGEHPSNFLYSNRKLALNAARRWARNNKGFAAKIVPEGDGWRVVEVDNAISNR